MSQRDFRDFKKRKLSASSDGRGIKVGATASPGTLIHTATPSVAGNEWDAVYIQAVNTSATAVKLTVQWGGMTSPDDLIEISIPGESGFYEVIPGHVLQNAKEVRAFADTTNVLVLHGYVHRFEQNQ